MRILIVKIASLGDVAQSLPALQDLRRARPGARIDWLVDPRFAGVLRRVDGVSEVIPVPLARWRLAWWSGEVRREYRALKQALAGRHYDAVIDLQGLASSAFVARLAPLVPGGRRHGIGNRVDGQEWETASRWLLDHAVPVEPRSHAVDLARAVCAGALGYAVEGAARYGLEHRRGAAPEGPPTVAFIHGASRDEALWPQAHWLALGKRVLGMGWRIALPQRDEAEQTRAELIAAALQFERAPLVEVWPSMKKLESVFDRLAGVQGVIGIDSGLSRLALGLGLPQVQIHVGSSAWRTGPQAAHGRPQQVAVEGKVSPDAVWAAWQRVAGRAAA